jgi:MFS family permease
LATRPAARDRLRDLKIVVDHFGWPTELDDNGRRNHLDRLARLAAKRNVATRIDANGAHILGYLLAALAAGGLVGNLLIGRPDLERGRRRMFSGIESIVFSATLILLAVSGGRGLAMLAMFMTGVAWQAAFVQKLTWIQHDSPPE